MNTEQRQIYINQIRRLQVENKVLRSVVAEERLRRQRAYGWYIRKINSRMLWILDLMIFSLTYRSRIIK